MKTALRDAYGSLERRYPVEARPDLADLVAPNGNDQARIHRWFHMKEGFSCHLWAKVVEITQLTRRRKPLVVDPFVGGGTTVVSAMLDSTFESSGVSALGLEVNPFIAELAKTKVRAAQLRPDGIKEFARELVIGIQKGRTEPAMTPALSTFSNRSYFSAESLRALLQLKRAIDEAETDSLTRSLARVCLAGCIEPGSFLRRDGRALRFQEDKKVSRVLDEFERRADMIGQDLSEEGIYGKGRIIHGDGRKATLALPRQVGRVDLVLFSPPYPNNIDYTEVYKMELWLLGLINNEASFRTQRLRTLRSHPSVSFPETQLARDLGLASDFDALLAPIIDALPNTSERRWRERLVRGYFEDMLITLNECRSLLKRRGHLVYVVGNSLHGSREHRFVIAADLVIARLAELLGYSVDVFAVARRGHRRPSRVPFVRESIVFLRRP